MERRRVADAFEALRPRLRAIGHRLLGSAHEADDAVQEAWLRLDRTDPAEIDNLAAWLTTVTSRICLDALRARASRREHVSAVDDDVTDPAAGPEDEALHVDAVGRAMLVVLDTLSPAERVAFVMHDLFGVPFADLAPVVGREPAATRQLASRARRRVQQAEEVPDRERQGLVVRAFLAASRHGEFEDLLTLLDPGAVLRADGYALELVQSVAAQGAPKFAARVEGAQAVAAAFSGQAKGARPALVDGGVGFVWAPGGEPRAVFRVSVRDGRVAEVALDGEPATIAAYDVVLEPRDRW